MWAHVNPRSPGEHGKRLEVVGLWAADLQRTHQQGVGLRQDHPPSLILQLLFRFLFFFGGRLVQPVDFHWFSTTSPFSFPLVLSFHSSEPLLAKPPGSASLKTTGFKQGSQLCCLGRFGGEWRGEERTLLKSSRDSPHSSDGLLQAQVWRGFGFKFQMKSSGRNAWLGQLKGILPPHRPPPQVQGD